MERSKNIEFLKLYVKSENLVKYVFTVNNGWVKKLNFLGQRDERGKEFMLVASRSVNSISDMEVFFVPEPNASEKANKKVGSICTPSQR